MSSGALLVFWMGMMVGIAVMGLVGFVWVTLHEHKRHPDCRIPTSWKVWW